MKEDVFLNLAFWQVGEKSKAKTVMLIRSSCDHPINNCVNYFVLIKILNCVLSVNLTFVLRSPRVILSVLTDWTWYFMTINTNKIKNVSWDSRDNICLKLQSCRYCIYKIRWKTKKIWFVCFFICIFSPYWSFVNKRVRIMVLNTTFNNIPVISWQSVLLMEETGVPRKNDRPAPSHLDLMAAA